MIRGIKERVRNSFVIKHSYAYQLRNIETEETMAYFQNKQSAWFKRMSEARLLLEEQEENSLQSENIQCPGTKWVFEANLLVEVKIIEDLQAPLHIRAGRLPDWLRYKRCLLALDKYADELCIFRCIAVHQGAHRIPNTRKTRELAASFFDKHRVRARNTKVIFL